jgi:shikimate kinase
MKIYLVGYMGSGKSTLGRDISHSLGFPWIDLDNEFEAKYKICIPDFFEKYGEATFRELEHKLLEDISVIPKCIVSTGGGTPCFHNNMALMNQTGITVYLSVLPEVLISRIGPSAVKRPLFHKMEGKDLLQNVEQHLKSREVYYKQARLTIDANTPDINALEKLLVSYSQNSSGA